MRGASRLPRLFKRAVVVPHLVVFPARFGVSQDQQCLHGVFGCVLAARVQEFGSGARCGSKTVRRDCSAAFTAATARW